jgi:hypothetical protein
VLIANKLYVPVVRFAAQGMRIVNLSLKIIRIEITNLPLSMITQYKAEAQLSVLCNVSLNHGDFNF